MQPARNLLKEQHSFWRRIDIYLTLVLFEACIREKYFKKKRRSEWKEDRMFDYGRCKVEVLLIYKGVEASLSQPPHPQGRYFFGTHLWTPNPCRLRPHRYRTTSPGLNKLITPKPALPGAFGGGSRPRWLKIYFPEGFIHSCIRHCLFEITPINSSRPPSMLKPGVVIYFGGSPSLYFPSPSAVT